jgi:hypothetical protein
VFYIKWCFITTPDVFVDCPKVPTGDIVALPYSARKVISKFAKEANPSMNSIKLRDSPLFSYAYMWAGRRQLD